MATGEHRREPISASELDAVLEQARAEAWQQLALLGPWVGGYKRADRIPRTRTFFLKEPLGPRIVKLTSLTGLTTLNLSENQIGDDGARALANLTNLASLDLSLNQIGDHGARALANLANLANLDLSHNQIGDDGARALANLANLASLDLRHNQIGDDGARALSSLASLSSLDLSLNQIGDDGARALANLANLANLYLGDNRIGTDGARALASLASLSSLDLSFNQIGTDGARALANLASLSSLDLSDNQIGTDGARALASLANLAFLDLSLNQIGTDGARSLASLASLSSLDLSRNQIGDDGARALSSLASLSSLDLSRNQIGDDGARALSSLASLSSLDLSRNQIGDDGARALSSLASLSSLDLSCNQIGDDGARALSSLASLSSLDLSRNQIGDDGARALSSLASLSSLDLSRNQIGDDGARALSSLSSLTSLHLSVNQIGADGARALSSLASLTSLHLSRNQIGPDGARALSSLASLTSLHLRDNQIGADGAHALASLASLSSLDLRDNQIGADGASALLDAWCDHPRSATLQRLDLRNNGDMTSMLPPELLDSADAQPILAAYRRYRDAEQRNTLRPLNEAKLVVVGNEAVGKTSLIRYLVHDRPRDPDEQKTPGTAIHEKIEVSAWSPHQSRVRLNVWDFGGQELMRGTHRFFLTERSLYLLVLEDRREDDRSLYEWLELIAQRGGDSPVIVVINKSDHDVPQRQLDETTLRRTYPAIAAFARTSCNAGAAQSIAGLRAQIAVTLSESERLKHVRDPIPLSWLRIKDAIAEQARDRSVLPVRDFERLCERNPAGTEPILDPDEQRALLGLLHDLGVVVAHGLRQDAPAARREITVLDPNWLTGAIYALINSPKVRDQGGELHHEQLAELLDPKRYPPRWHELILSMMQEPALGLCLPIPHTNPTRYLLPDALPVNGPDYGVWPDDALRFRYQYSLLPTGFLPRFIVESHRNLTARPTWWRTGVVLGAEGCRILVRGDTARHRVEILVAGKTAQREALSIVRNHFDAVHHYYARLKVEERVPLPDQPDVDVGYQHLIRLEDRKGLEHMYLPENALREYSVRELLEGVRDDSARRYRRREDEASAPVSNDRGDFDGGEAAPRRARPAVSPYRGKVDFGILTIREDENAAVLRRFDKVVTDKQQRVYRIRTLKLPSGGAYTLAVLRCLEQGNTDAQAAANAILEDLAPRFLLVVGIAGGAPAYEFSLGDVVVSSRIVDFSVEAVLRGKKREYALGGGPLHPDAAKLAADVSAMITDDELPGWSALDAFMRERPPVDLNEENFYGKDEWKKSVRDKLERHFAGKPPRPPLAVTGALASSDRLVKEDETLAVWLKIARQVVAVEMESAGIYKSTQGRNVPFLAIRGISDVVGFKRHPDWTSYACETAAAFAKAFLLTEPITPIADR
jgi:internalin A